MRAALMLFFCVMFAIASNPTFAAGSRCKTRVVIVKGHQTTCTICADGITVC